MDDSKNNEKDGAPPDGTSTKHVADLAAVLNWIIEHSTRANMPAGWEFLSKYQAARCFEALPGDVIQELLTAFGAGLLLDCNVLVQVEGAYVLNQVFGGGRAPFTVETDAQGVPTDVVSTYGRLSGRIRHLVSCGQQRISTGEQDLLWLVAEPGDAMVLNGLGYQVEGLRNLKLSKPTWIKKLYNCRPEFRGSWRFKIAILAYSLARNSDEMDSSTREGIQYLCDYEEVYEREIDGLVTVWMPRPPDAAKIALARQFGNRAIVKRWMSVNSDAHFYTPRDALRELDEKTPLSYATAHRQLNDAIASFRKVPSPSELARALHDFRRSFESLTVDPLLRQCDDDPSSNLLRIGAARYSSRWLDLFGVVEGARRLEKYESVDVAALDAELSGKQMEMFDELCKIHRQLSARR